MFILKRIMPKLWHLHFETQYDLTMHFLRFQEYYENPEFAGKFFTISKFKKWYKKFSGKTAFTYPKDWGGFNIPSFALLPFINNPKEAFPDKNIRDELMLGIIKTIITADGKKFYLIGTFGDQSLEALKHEIAHALYYLNNKYKNKMQKNIAKLGELKIKKLHKLLAEKMYGENVLDDELQAYAAAGIMAEMKTILSPKDRKVFISTFKKYLKKQQKT